VNQRTPTDNNLRLRAWFRTRLGRLLLEQERRLVADALEDVFGFQLLQIGRWGENAGFFEAARTQRHTLLASALDGRPDVCCKTSELAIASDSIDAVLLPHTLEFEVEPHAVLREVQRVLVSEGHLLLLGFSAGGTWALRHHLSDEGFPPSLVQLISERRARDWLALLGFEVTSARRYLFRLPFPPRRSAKRASRSVFESSGLLPANAYLLKARKRVYALTPVLPKWRERRPLVGGLVEPTTRIRS
jgi:SAM-dependent methyltransferase